MAKQAKKSKKQGRNAKSGQNAAYQREDRHTKSHVRRIKAHIARYAVRTGKPQVDSVKRKRSLIANGDQVAIQALAKYNKRLGVFV